MKIGHRFAARILRLPMIMGRALFIILSDTAIWLAGGGGAFTAKRTGLLYLALWSIWWVVTFVGRPEGKRSAYGDRQRKLVAISGTLMLPWITLVPPLEYAALQGPIERDGVLSGIGFMLFAAGILVQAAAMWQLRGYFTVRLGVQPDQKLVTTGLYRHIRHPGYLSYLITIFGAGLALGSLGGMAASLPAAAFTIARIRAEEAMLRKEFGDAYEHYMKNTSRLIPGVY